MNLVHGLQIRRSLYFVLSILVNEKNCVAWFEQQINAPFSNSVSVGELGKGSLVGDGVSIWEENEFEWSSDLSSTSWDSTRESLSGSYLSISFSGDLGLCLISLCSCKLVLEVNFKLQSLHEKFGLLLFIVMWRFRTALVLAVKEQWEYLKLFSFGFSGLSILSLSSLICAVINWMDFSRTKISPEVQRYHSDYYYKYVFTSSAPQICSSSGPGSICRPLGVFSCMNSMCSFGLGIFISHAVCGNFPQTYKSHTKNTCRPLPFSDLFFFASEIWNYFL